MPAVYVIDIVTGDVTEAIEVNPLNIRQHERFMRGLLTNLDRDRYLVDDDEVRFEQTD